MATSSTRMSVSESKARPCQSRSPERYLFGVTPSLSRNSRLICLHVTPTCEAHFSTESGSSRQGLEKMHRLEQMGIATAEARGQRGDLLVFGIPPARHETHVHDGLRKLRAEMVVDQSQQKIRRGHATSTGDDPVIQAIDLRDGPQPRKKLRETPDVLPV